jgi:hypothetical protein
LESFTEESEVNEGMAVKRFYDFFRLHPALRDEGATQEGEL